MWIPKKRFCELNYSRQLRQNIQPHMTKLLNHKLYSNLKNLEDAKILMESHVFAVWDFMSLLKSLQIQLTCVRVPWIPVNNSKNAHFINSIVLGEESDDFGTKNPSNALSHFELYINSMRELGADTAPIIYLIKQLSEGNNWKASLRSTQKLYSYIPDSTFSFVNHTLELCEKSNIHEIASSFLFGREDPIPRMFKNIIINFDEKRIICPNFRTYLERHIEVDSGEHSLIAQKLISELCKKDPKKWLDAEEEAIKSINQRLLLWDGVLERLEMISKQQIKMNNKI